MEFWKRFYNQPMLWGLGLMVFFAIGLGVSKTPNLIIYNNVSSSSDGLLVDIITHYAVLSGVTFIMSPTSLTLAQQCNIHYSPVAGVILVALLFMLVVLITRKSSSAIYILGPLLAGEIIAMIVNLKYFHTEVKVGLDVLGMLWNWLLVFGGTGVGVFLLARYLVRQGLISGIDSDGPLDFSRLQQAAVTTAGTLGQTANTMGNRISQSIGEGNVLSNSSSMPMPSRSSQPIFSQFKIRKCIACGCDIKNGKCCVCRNPINNYRIDPLYGICSDCHAPKAMRAHYCYNCGLLFENEGEPIYSNEDAISSGEDFVATKAIRYCPDCGNRLQPSDQYCSVCGKSTAAMSFN